MHLPLPILRFGMVALVFAAPQMPVLGADDLVGVELTNGNRVKAAIEGRTDGSRLWLTTSLGRGRLSQSIPWEHVREVEIEGQRFEGRVVRAAVATVRDAELPRLAPLPRQLEQPDTRRIAKGLRLRQAEATLPVAESRAPSPVKVQAMTVSARLANWDQDTAVDGLIVELTPRDSLGNRVSCNGTVNIELQAWKTSGRGGRMGICSERWTRSVTAGDFDSGSVFLQLPFRVIQPQLNSDWWSHGVLQIRLAAPGSGVVERTLTDLRLRPFEPMRDTLEQRTGRRNFPGENVQRQGWTPAWR